MDHVDEIKTVMPPYSTWEAERLKNYNVYNNRVKKLFENQTTHAAKH